MQDYMPQRICISPTYGGEYVSDENSCATLLTLVFETHPNIDKILEIETKLLNLAGLVDACALSEMKVPWDYINTEGLKLAQEMAVALGDIGIPIIYQLHNNDRTRISISSTEAGLAASNGFVDP